MVVRIISKPEFTLLLKVSERTVFAVLKTLVVRLFVLKFLKRRSVVASKVGRVPSQFSAESQLPVTAAALPFHVVPAVA